MTCEDYHVSSDRWPITTEIDSFYGFIHHTQYSHSLNPLHTHRDEVWAR